MIEFALIFPTMIFFTVLSLDLGLAILHYGGLQDAAYSAARSAAQSGGAEVGGVNHEKTLNKV
jgi:Flp pilus assembly protein TadG